MKILWNKHCFWTKAFKFVCFEPCARNFSSARELTGETLEKFANHLKDKCNNVLVMTGAGLSTPSGIPDFRSPDTGLYYNLKQYNLPYPEAIFDLGFFARDPRPFLTLAKELYPGEKYHPNLGHHFIHLLHHKGKLLRMYTQNIDGLERLTGIPEERLIEAHGGFSTASCIRCFKKHDPDKTREMILNGEIVYCERTLCKTVWKIYACIILQEYLNGELLGDFTKYMEGLVKPDIVFFGEALPDSFWLHKMDALFADFLIVIGTSLEVYPFAGVADSVQDYIPRLLVNRDIVGSFGYRELDILMIGDITESIKTLATALGWINDLEGLAKDYENKITRKDNF